MGDFTKASNQEKELKGQSRYVKNTPDTAPIEKLWKVPINFPKRAAIFYKNIGAILVKARVLTPLDMDNFIRLARLHDRLCGLENDLEEAGEYIITDGKYSRHPAALSYEKIFPQYLKLSERFGLDPYNRQRINLPTDSNPKKDKAREFLNL